MRKSPFDNVSEETMKVMREEWKVLPLLSFYKKWKTSATSCYKWLGARKTGKEVLYKTTSYIKSNGTTKNSLYIRNY